MGLRVKFLNKDSIKCILDNVISPDRNHATLVKETMVVFNFKQIYLVRKYFSSDCKRIALGTVLKDCMR